MNVNGFKSKKSAMDHLKAHGFSMASVLGKPEQNPKTAKSMKVDVLTAPLNLAPASLSGFNVCPQASAGCIKACLHTAGNRMHQKGKDASRIAKARAYMGKDTRAAFVAGLVFDLAAHERRAIAKGMKPAARLNTTSDISWERVRVTIDGVEYPNVMAAFPEIQFYDYTKVTKRAIAFGLGQMPDNYHLTFSRSEENESDCGKVLAAGGNVAAVFSKEIRDGLNELRDAQGKINWYLGGVSAWTVDGDETDFRPADGKGVIVVLYAKGDAKKDESGFVIQSATVAA